MLAGLGAPREKSRSVCHSEGVKRPKNLRQILRYTQNDNKEKRDDVFSKVLDEQTFLTGQIDAEYAQFDFTFGG